MSLTTSEICRMAGQTVKHRSGKGRGEVILAIEDEEMLRDYLETILGEDGYRVILAADGAEGVQIFMEHMHEIKLVLLDMGLPKISGEEVLSRIVSSRPETRVIAVSGYVEPEVQAGALRTGAAAYLRKPYPMDILLREVHRTLHETVRFAT